MGSGGAVVVEGEGRHTEGIDGGAGFLWPVPSASAHFWWCSWLPLLGVWLWEGWTKQRP